MSPRLRLRVKQSYDRAIRGDDGIPFTSFHFGPGVLVKACGASRFWLTAFVLANVLVDIEVLYYLINRDPPLHRYSHTYVGGIVSGLAAGLIMLSVGQLACRLLPERWLWVARLRLATKTRLAAEACVSGLIGGVSHIFLDSLIHHDMNPFWPFGDGNALAGMVSSGSLHMTLALSGLFGVVVFVLLRPWQSVGKDTEAEQ